MRLVFFTAAVASARVIATVPKHVLQIIVDDLGFSDLSYKAELYNISGPLFPTPFIDSLALAGVRLESTYVHALCSPSRGAFLSGRYAYTTGGNAEVIVDGVPDQLPTNIRTVADLLHAHGWATAGERFANGRMGVLPYSLNTHAWLTSLHSVWKVGRWHDDVGLYAFVPGLRPPSWFLQRGRGVFHTRRWGLPRFAPRL